MHKNGGNKYDVGGLLVAEAAGPGIEIGIFHNDSDALQDFIVQYFKSQDRGDKKKDAKTFDTQQILTQYLRILGA